MGARPARGRARALRRGRRPAARRCRGRARRAAARRRASSSCSIASARSKCWRCATATASTEARVRTGGDRRTAERGDVRAAAAGGDDGRNRGRGSRAHAARHPDRRQRARCCRTSSCSRAGCTTSCRRASIAAALPADDPERLQERGRAARSRVRAARRERVQDQRAVARERPRHVAVHGRHRAGVTASMQNWFVDERSDPEKATRAAAQYLKTLQRDVRRRLELRARQLQRRAGPAAAARCGGRRRPTTGRSRRRRATCRARRASTCR